MICFLCCFLAQVGLAAAAEPAAPELSARSAILIEANTGAAVYEKNAAARLYPASTTKMMTAILALESGKAEEVVTVGKDAAGTEGSSMNLSAGDKLHFMDLLYGVMMASGNDATIVLADYLSGSVENFAAQMTKKAREIGAKDTHFANSSGLPDPNHYSTAYDLSRIAMYGYKNEAFRRLVSTAKRKIDWVEPQKSEVLENTNLLLHDYPGANGIKTGYTEAAGECLVASAERGGVHLIAVVMHADKDKRFDEAAKLLDYGFEKVKLYRAYARDDLARTVHVRQGRDYQVSVRPEQDIFYPLVNGGLADFSIRMELPRFVEAPVKKGQAVGYVSVCYKGREIEQVKLVADRAAEKGFNIIALFIAWYDALFETLKGFTFS